MRQPDFLTRIGVLVLLTAAAPAAPAKTAATGPQMLNLSSLADTLATVNAFDLDPAKPVPRKGGLLELKWLELRRQWASCRNLAARLQGANKDVEGWVARTRLECAMKSDTPATAAARSVSAPAGTSPGLIAAFDAVKPALLLEGAWQNPLRDSWAKAGLAIADAAAKTKPDVARRRLETLLERADVLTKDQRVSALVQLGNIAAQKKDFEQALFFLRQAEDLISTAALQSRIADLESKRATKKDARELPETPAAAVGAEAEADADIQKALADGRREDALKSMVDVLNRFPNGRFARRYRDRALELLRDAAGDEDGGAKARAAVKHADASRLADWAGVLHRRGDDRGSMELAERALDKLSDSPQAARLLWIAGRGASFLGLNDRAARHFDRVVQFHSAADEAPESLFRLALLQVREGNDSTAAGLFDKLIARNVPKYDLNARYWRVRSLERLAKSGAAAGDRERFSTERDELIERYPFTYYGLRLKAERDGGNLEFAKNDRSPLEATEGKLWLVGAQRKSWERFKKLSAEGWLLEAQAELAGIPAPQTPWAMIEWARALAKAGQFPSAIVFVSRAIDREETLRHPHYLESVFPRSYSRWIEPSSKEKSIDPALVRSLIRQESAFGLRAVSSSNAMGLMQMIPPTAREIADEMKLDVAIPEDMYRPEVNVPMGTHYVAKMLREFDGNVPLALAGYNAGPHRIGKWLKQRPELAALKGRDFSSWEDEIWYDELPWDETSFYVKAILRNVLIDRLIDQGRVAVTPSFWKDLRKDGEARLDEAANATGSTKKR